MNNDISTLSVDQLDSVTGGFDFGRTAHAAKVGAVSGGVGGMLLGIPLGFGAMGVGAAIGGAGGAISGVAIDTYNQLRGR